VQHGTLLETRKFVQTSYNGRGIYFGSILAGLHKLAVELGIAVLVVHHTRKMAAEDIMDTVSGSFGLVGAADTIIVIERRSQGTVLDVRGRDVESAELAIEFNKQTCRWTLLGSAADLHKSDERAHVLAASRGISVISLNKSSRTPDSASPRSRERLLVKSEKSNSTLLVAIAMASTFLFVGAAHANCLEAWPPDMKTRPDFTCVPLTDRLLVSLQGATKAEVIKAMKANGRPVDHDKVLHFVSTADRYSGDMNFEIEGDKVVRIFGVVDSAANTSSIKFIWNPAYPDMCSDLPGSRYAECDK
jgi:hypothetical protein